MSATPLNEGDLRRLAEITGSVLLAAIDRDHEAINRYVNEVIDRWGAAGMYCLCCGLAGAFKGLTSGTDPVGGATVFTVGDIDIDNLPPEARPPLFAARFLAAYLNDDHAMAGALFRAPLVAGDGEGLNRNFSALLNIVSDVGREKERAVRRRGRS